MSIVNAWTIIYFRKWKVTLVWFIQRWYHYTMRTNEWAKRRYWLWSTKQQSTVNKFIASGKRCERFASNFIYIIWKQIWLSENCIALPRTISSRFNFLLCLHTTFRLMKWIAMDAQARFSNVEMLLFFLRSTWQYTLSWLKCYVRLDPTSQFTNDDDGRK